MARARRFQFHLGPFRNAFLALLLIACASGTAKADRQGKTLFLLTGTSLADTSQTFPVRLYKVSTGHKLKLFRTLVSGRVGTSGILDDMRDEIYVTFPSDYGVSRAPTKVSIIHESRPWENDVVTFNPKVMFVWPYASVTAEGPGQSSYALFVLLPPHSPNGHVAFMRFVRSSAMTLVAISGNPLAKGPRVIRNEWSLYSHLMFSGTPGGPNSYFTPDAAIESGKLVMRLGGENIPVDQAPPALPTGAAGHEIRVVAANRRFVVTWFWRASDRFAPAVFYVHDRQLGKWRELKFRWNLPQSRIFGPWLATIAMSYVGIGVGGWRDTNPGHMDESHPWVKYERPDVRFEFGALRMGDRIPGMLILDNLVDGRRIILRTNEEDNEILDVRKDGLVLYRVNNEIFEAHIEGDKLSAPTLVVKGEDVPEVHWVFWSKARSVAHPVAQGNSCPRNPLGYNGDGLKGPVAIYCPEPACTTQAMKAHCEGAAVLWCVVNAKGMVTDAQMVKPLGNGFDQSAMKTVRTWRFKPATLNGRHVSARILVEVHFNKPSKVRTSVRKKAKGAQSEPAREP